MSRFVYADHAATTKLCKEALDAMMPYLTAEYGNPSSPYRFAGRAKEALEKARGQTASCLGAEAGEIYFTSGGSESDNWALRAAAELKRNKGRHIITSAVEHHAVLHTAEWLHTQGFEITYLPVDSAGRVSPDDLAAALRPDTVLVSVMAANNEIGTIQPIRELAAAAHKGGALFHTDAVQAAGHIPVDVRQWDVDLLSLSAHKFCGPRGMGALFVRSGLRLPPLIFGGGQEKGRRSGTENVAGAVGMAAALVKAVETMPQESARLTALRDKLIGGLKKISGSRLTGHPTDRLPGCVSFIFEAIEGESIVLRLDNEGICASSGSACSSASLDPSHVLLAIGLPHELAHGSLRLTLGEETGEGDVDYLLEKVPQVVKDLRAMSPLWTEAS